MSLLRQTHLLFPQEPVIGLDDVTEDIRFLSQRPDEELHSTARLVARQLDSISRGGLVNRMSRSARARQRKKPSPPVSDMSSETELLRNVLTGIPGTVIVLDAHGRLIVYNRDTALTLGLDAQTLSTITFWPTLQAPNPDVKARLNKFFVAALQNVFASKSNVFVDDTMPRKLTPDDKVILRYTISPLLTSNGKKHGLLLVIDSLPTTEWTPEVRDEQESIEDRFSRVSRPSYFHQVFGRPPKQTDSDSSSKNILSIRKSPDSTAVDSVSRVASSNTNTTTVSKHKGNLYSSHVLPSLALSRQPRKGASTAYNMALLSKQAPGEAMVTPRAPAPLQELLAQSEVYQASSTVTRVPSSSASGIAPAELDLAIQQKQELQEAHNKLLADFERLSQETRALEATVDGLDNDVVKYRARLENVDEKERVHLEMQSEWVKNEATYRDEILALRKELEASERRAVDHSGSYDRYMSNVQGEQVELDGDLDYWLVSILNPHEAVLMRQPGKRPGSRLKGKGTPKKVVNLSALRDDGSRRNVTLHSELNTNASEISRTSSRNANTRVVRIKSQTPIQMNGKWGDLIEAAENVIANDSASNSPATSVISKLKEGIQAVEIDPDQVTDEKVRKVIDQQQQQALFGEDFAVVPSPIPEETVNDTVSSSPVNSLPVAPSPRSHSFTPSEASKPLPHFKPLPVSLPLATEREVRDPPTISVFSRGTPAKHKPMLRVDTATKIREDHSKDYDELDQLELARQGEAERNYQHADVISNKFKAQRGRSGSLLRTKPILPSRLDDSDIGGRKIGQRRPSQTDNLRRESISKMRKNSIASVGRGGRTGRTQNRVDVNFSMLAVKSQLQQGIMSAERLPELLDHLQQAIEVLQKEKLNASQGSLARINDDTKVAVKKARDVKKLTTRKPAKRRSSAQIIDSQSNRVVESSKRRGSIFEIQQDDEDDLDFWLRRKNSSREAGYSNEFKSTVFFCAVLETKDIQRSLGYADKYDIKQFVNFDIFDINELTGHRALQFVFIRMLQEHNLINALGLKENLCMNFIEGIQKLYSPFNPYHMATHGADVLHGCMHLLRYSGAAQQLTSLEKLGMIIAAACHDVAHPGLTNAFLIQSRSHLAVRYNDCNVLEHFHVATAFSLMRKDKYNMLSSLSELHYFTIRKFIIELILATDLSEHVRVVSQFKARFVKSEENPNGVSPLARDGPTSNTPRVPHSPKTPTSWKERRQLPELDADDRLLLCKMLLKAADIGHPTRKWDLHFEWSRRLTEEFFLQGDQERKLGVAVSPMTDRSKHAGIPKSQVGFIVFLVQPLYTVLSSIFGTNIWMERLKRNKMVWQQLADVLKDEEEDRVHDLAVAAHKGDNSLREELELKQAVEQDVAMHQSVVQIYVNFEKKVTDHDLLYTPEEYDDERLVGT